MTARKVPPFGREVQAALAEPKSWPQYAGTSADGQHLTIWIAIGVACWEWAQEHRGKFLLMICPPDADPKDFNWRVVADEKHAPVLMRSCGAVQADRHTPARRRQASGFQVFDPYRGVYRCVDHDAIFGDLLTILLRTDWKRRRPREAQSEDRRSHGVSRFGATLAPSGCWR